MAYSRVASNLIIDNAHADGMITTPGIGRDWPAIEPRDNELTFSPDLGGQYGWFYDGQFEYIDKLGGIAPLGTVAKTSMALSNWTVTQGKWRNSAYSGNLQTQYLHYYDAEAARYAANEYGILTSKNSYAPNLVFWIWRMGSAPAETDPALFGIHFLGSGGAVQYALYLPAYKTGSDYEAELTGRSGRTELQPYLLGKPAVENTWTLVDKLNAGSVPSVGGTGNTSKFQVLRIEYIDGTMLVQMNDAGQAWAFKGTWKTNENRDVEFALANGPIQVRVMGHMAQFGMAQIAYPSTALLRPQAHFYVPAPYEQTPNYRTIKHEEAGATISVAAWASAMGPARTYPAATFATTDTSRRAILYNVQEYRNPTIGGAVSSEVCSGASNTFKLVSVNGLLDENWRGATLNAEVEARPGYTLADLKPNSKLKCFVSTNDGTTSYKQFTGYVTPPEKFQAGGPVRVKGTLAATDIFAARLEKKCMHFHCSYEGTGDANGWTVPGAFEHVLHRAGVPDALISIHADLTLANMGAAYYMPSSTAKGLRKFSFDPDAGVVAALDTITAAGSIPSAVTPYLRRGLCSGVDQDGVVFLRPAYEHTAGAYDLTLDEDTATLEDIAENLTSKRTLADFTNYLIVMAGEGVDAVQKVLIDQASWSTSTSQRFIGDLWQRFMAYPDGTDVDAIAASLWAQLGHMHWLIEFDQGDNPDIMPDEEVRVQTSNLNIPTNSIYRIIGKDWKCKANGRFSQTLTAVMVESG